MRWTKDQAGAIEARGTNLLVAAAAALEVPVFARQHSMSVVPAVRVR